MSSAVARTREQVSAVGLSHIVSEGFRCQLKINWPTRPQVCPVDAICGTKQISSTVKQCGNCEGKLQAPQPFVLCCFATPLL